MRNLTGLALGHAKGHPYWGGEKGQFKKGHPDLVPKESRGHTEETKKKLSISGKGKHTGEKAWNWIKDRSKVKGRHNRNFHGPDYKQWRMNVWIRDNFKCKIADENCKGRIEAHHILVWRLYPELRYEINNGITLCHAHHPRRRADEERLIPVFKQLVGLN
jgi:hypothetical protein